VKVVRIPLTNDTIEIEDDEILAYKIVKEYKYKGRKILVSNVAFCEYLGRQRHLPGVIYAKGKPTRAKRQYAKAGYHICVFDTKGDIRKWAGNYTAFHDTLFLVACKDKVTLPQMLDWRWVSEDGLDAQHMGQWPSGTSMYKQVTLLKEVHL